MREVVFFPFVVVNVICLELKNCWTKKWSAARALKFAPYWYNPDCNILVINGHCQLSLDGVESLVFFWFFGVVLLLTGFVDDNGLVILTSLFNLLGGVGCETGNLWDGSGGNTGGTGTIWYFTGKEICGRVGGGVTTGIAIVGFWWLFWGFMIF